MAKTLLQGVNAILTKAGKIDSQGELTTLSDSARQSFIDTAVQSINETMDDLFDLADTTKPLQVKEANLTLIAGKQNYVLRSDLLKFRQEFHLIDETNNHIIAFLDAEDGYNRLIFGDLEQDDTGLPSYAAIRPTDGHLWLGREPTATEAGRIYKYRYDRDMELEDKDDIFPMQDAAYRGLIVAATEVYRSHKNTEFSQTVFDRGLARAARFLRKTTRRRSYAPRRASHNVTDPMNGSSIS